MPPPLKTRVELVCVFFCEGENKLKDPVTVIWHREWFPFLRWSFSVQPAVTMPGKTGLIKQYVS